MLYATVTVRLLAILAIKASVFMEVWLRFSSGNTHVYYQIVNGVVHNAS